VGGWGEGAGCWVVDFRTRANMMRRDEDVQRARVLWPRMPFSGYFERVEIVLRRKGDGV